MPVDEEPSDTECNTELADHSQERGSEMPTHCSGCQSPLCLRKQVVNMVLDNIQEMYCLECLGKINGKEPLEVLLSARSYIMRRECFRKEWIRYENKSQCPEPLTCFINDCFAADDCQ